MGTPGRYQVRRTFLGNATAMSNESPDLFGWYHHEMYSEPCCGMVVRKNMHTLLVVKPMGSLDSQDFLAQNLLICALRGS